MPIVLLLFLFGKIIVLVAQVVPVQPVAQVQVPLVQVAPFKQKSVILQGFESKFSILISLFNLKEPKKKKKKKI